MERLGTRCRRRASIFLGLALLVIVASILGLYELFAHYGLDAKMLDISVALAGGMSGWWFLRASRMYHLDAIRLTWCSHQLRFLNQCYSHLQEPELEDVERQLRLVGVILASTEGVRVAWAARTVGNSSGKDKFADSLFRV